MNIYSTSQIDSVVLRFLQTCQKFDPILYSIFYNQYLTGCRFDDIHNLARWELKNDNTLILSPCKKNNLRVFNINEVDFLLYEQIRYSYNVYQSISFSTALLHFGRLFPNPNLMIKNKPVKTHIFRHLKARKLKASGMSDHEIKEYLGERNMMSAHSYIYSVIYD
ncbi:hypothetical protein [Capnocytophaga canis]|uniref:hypothetical protein n=1 Tax=Capnocytophaga canis TaxID=1848903 RepID=UPI001562C64C|nr:hypothetical protein [Capnocytophaga canis]